MLGFYFSCHLSPKALWLFEKEIVVRRACYSQYRIYRPLPFPAGQVFRPEKAAANVDKSQSHEKKLCAILSAPSTKTGGTGISNRTPKIEKCQYIKNDQYGEELGLGAGSDIKTDIKCV